MLIVKSGQVPVNVTEIPVICCSIAKLVVNNVVRLQQDLYNKKFVDTNIEQNFLFFWMIFSNESLVCRTERKHLILDSCNTDKSKECYHIKKLHGQVCFT